jgi:signal transduction histidine kinase
VLERTLDRYRELSDARQLSVSLSVAANVCVEAHAGILDAVADNLVANACRYATPSGDVRIDVVRDGPWVFCTFDNSDSTLSRQDLDAIFEPFWRKDMARTSGTNVGLGLSLSRSYCQAMDVKLLAELPSAGVFRIRLRFRAVDRPLIAITDNDKHIVEAVAQ